MVTQKDLDREIPNWCPGCGDFGILTALKMAVLELNIPLEQFVLVSGIGCSSKIPYWINTIGFNSLHGRALPIAQGIKLANTKLTVVVMGGDGDGYSEGTQHFIHACKRNHDIAYFVHDNEIYALTKGQTSPTSDEGFVTKTTPDGNIETPFNPISVAIASGATFVARAFAGDILHLKQLMVEAIKHKGFAIVDILQPCVSFNHVNTFQFWKERVYKLEDQKHDYKNKELAMKKAMEPGPKIPIGIFFKEERHTYEDKVFAMKEHPLVEQPIDKADISENMNRYV
jgi:2-oxoglutarate/2-oxoacid ferredoxin oxidoreductase subunit beta